MSVAVIQWIEITVAVLLTTAVLMQVRGSGSSLFGQAESTFRSRRGVERALFRATIVLAAIFVLVAAISISNLVQS
jgi:preprotein translocase subunit SecG